MSKTSKLKSVRTVAEISSLKDQPKRIIYWKYSWTRAHPTNTQSSNQISVCISTLLMLLPLLILIPVPLAILTRLRAYLFIYHMDCGQHWMASYSPPSYVFHVTTQSVVPSPPNDMSLKTHTHTHKSKRVLLPKLTPSCIVYNLLNIKRNVVFHFHIFSKSKLWLNHQFDTFVNIVQNRTHSHSQFWIFHSETHKWITAKVNV